MKQILSLALTLCLSQVAFSQTDFRPGFIVTLSGDTIKGFIDYRERNTVYYSCDFKNALGETPVTYTPGKILAYGFNNDKLFESKKVTHKEGDAEMLFLETLVKGRVTAYRFKRIFLLQKEGLDLYELIEAKIVTSTGSLARKPNQHIGILNALMFDCTEIRPKLQQDIDLTEKSLTRLVEEYNRCVGSALTIPKSNKAWFKFRYALSAGINISKLEVKSLYNYDLAHDYDLSTSPFAGLSYEIQSPRISERFSFAGDIWASKTNYESHHEKIVGITPILETVKVSFIQLKVPLGVRYTFPSRRLTPFVNAGICTTFYLNADSQYSGRYTNGQLYRKDSEPFRIKDTQIGLWGGLGVSTSLGNKFNGSLELRMDQTKNITNNEIASLITNVQGVFRISRK